MWDALPEGRLTLRFSVVGSGICPLFAPGGQPDALTMPKRGHPSHFPSPLPCLQEQAVESIRTRKGLRTSVELQLTNTLDFWRHSFVPCPLYMGMGLCYNQFNKLGFDTKDRSIYYEKMGSRGLGI